MEQARPDRRRPSPDAGVGRNMRFDHAPPCHVPPCRLPGHAGTRRGDVIGPLSNARGRGIERTPMKLTQRLLYLAPLAGRGRRALARRVRGPLRESEPVERFPPPPPPPPPPGGGGGTSPRRYVRSFCHGG